MLPLFISNEGETDHCSAARTALLVLALLTVPSMIVTGLLIGKYLMYGYLCVPQVLFSMVPRNT